MTAKARTGNDFAKAHVREVYGPEKIRAVLEKLRAIGPEHWEYQGDLCKPPYSLSQTDLKDFGDQFAAHRIETDNRSGEKSRVVWFGDAKVAARYRPKIS